ncbi:MAG: lysozyme inhibitor LprI family protein [Thiothrix sp.]
MHQYFAPVAAAMLLATSAQARDAMNTIDLNTESCLSTNQSTAGMLECFTHAEQEWDTELNRVYKALQSKLKPAGQDALKQAQRAWIAQRDKEFELINAVHAQLDGTMWIAVMANKRADVVKGRAMALQAYFDLLTEGEPS